MVKYFLCLKISLSVVFGLFSLKSLQQNNDAIPARNVKILLVLNVSSIDIKLLIMELDIQMLKCMAAYLKKRAPSDCCVLARLHYQTDQTTLLILTN